MGSVGAALAGLRSGGLPTPARHWHNNETFLKCEIRVRQALLKPFDELNGNVVISLEKEMSSHGIFIQLDANINIEVEMKMDGQGSSTYKQKKGLLQSCETRGGGFIKSPVRQYLIKNINRFQPIIKLNPGRYTYPFKLVMPGEQLPAPFSSQRFGGLKYKLTVYMKNPCCYQMMAEKVLDFSGYNNLSLIPNFDEPLVHECGISSSLFSSKQSIRAVFTAEKKCFLPKEEIVFVLTIINPKSYLVKNMTACLVQRTVYNASWRKKVTLQDLNSFESTEISNDVEINCVGTLFVPESCVPSYNISPLWVYNLSHVIQYGMQIEGRSTLKGEVEIVIGTTRSTEEELKKKIQRRSSTSPSFFQGDSPSIPRRSRSQSIVSRVSTSSAVSTHSLPPTYSQLSSRTSSLHSIETLPPHYEDLR